MLSLSLEVWEQVSDLFEHKVCSILTGEMGKPSFELELNVLTIIKKNMFYKPPPHDVVEVTPVSYVLAN